MKLVLKKIISLIITLFIVSLLAFLAFQIIPGDPTTKLLGTSATPEKVAQLRSELGLDRPVMIRYLDWLVSFVKGEFGISYTYNRAVGTLLSDKLPVTVLLTVLSFLITAAVSIPIGIWAGSTRSKWLDHVFVILDQVLMAIISFLGTTAISNAISIQTTVNHDLKKLKKRLDPFATLTIEVVMAGEENANSEGNETGEMK